MDGTGERRYVLLPRVGIRAGVGPALDLLASMPIIHSTAPPLMHFFAAAQGRQVRIVDTVHESGAKLVELDEASAAAINAPQGPLRAVPVIEYGRPNPRPRPLGGGGIGAAGAGVVSVHIACTDAATGAPVPEVHVVAFTDFAQRIGAEGVSDAAGSLTLQLATSNIERLYAYPAGGYWGAYRSALSGAAPIALAFTPIDLAYVDAVRHYYGQSRFDRTAPVTVGVIDTGVGPHADLNLVGGHNTVTGEPAGDYADGDIHGTHVAGLIGAGGTPPTGLRGVAPGVAIRSYRVFPAGAGGATNYAILKAMIYAADDGCDIINLSLGGGPFDEIVSEAIADARNQGMLVVVASGNDGRKPVNYPAAYDGSTAISALGREGSFPAGSLDEPEILRPPTGTVDPAEFIAAFSNIGPQIAATGPGVGVLSTLPGNRFGPLSGTSMAAPVVAGATASLLSRDAAVLGMARQRSRSDAIEKLLQTNCVRRSFGAVYEGYGLPDPAVV